MSDYRDVAGWCEHQQRGATGRAIFPSSIALYPQNAIELGVALVRAAGNAVYRHLREAR